MLTHMTDRQAMRATELGEAEFVYHRVHDASSATKERLGIRTARIGGGIVSAMANDPAGGFFNVCVGLGQTEPVTDAVVDEVIAFATEAGAPLICFQVAPEADRQDWPDLFASKGIVGSRSWVKFAMLDPAVPAYETDLRIDTIGAEDAGEFSRVFIEGFEMPTGEGLEEWFAEYPGFGDAFTTYGAWDGDELVAAANLFVSSEAAVLAGAATLPAARGRGAQSALMSRRIEDALAGGARWITTETGADTPEDPNPSLHNMRRLGLVERYQRQNWIWKPSSGA